jgi:hypothetical protein
LSAIEVYLYKGIYQIPSPEEDKLEAGKAEQYRIRVVLNYTHTNKLLSETYNTAEEAKAEIAKRKKYEGRYKAIWSVEVAQ